MKENKNLRTTEVEVQKKKKVEEIMKIDHRRRLWDIETVTKHPQQAARQNSLAEVYCEVNV